MIAATYRRLYGFICPNCETPQPVLAMGLTYRGGLAQAPVNSWTHCTSCNARLRLAPRLGFVETAALQVGTALLLLSLMPFVVIQTLHASLTAFGLWGLLALPVVLVACFFGSAMIAGQIGGIYRQVVPV